MPLLPHVTNCHSASTQHATVTYRCKVKIVDDVVRHKLHISVSIDHKHEPIECLTHQQQTTLYLMHTHTSYLIPVSTVTHSVTLGKISTTNYFTLTVRLTKLQQYCCRFKYSVDPSPMSPSVMIQILCRSFTNVTKCHDSNTL